MNQAGVDLYKEQQASLARPCYNYSLIARFFFLAMDLATGRKITLAKTKLLEILASIPYRGWEALHYARLTRGYKNRSFVQLSCEIIAWARTAQDNEYRHLLIINEKMKDEGLRDPWYLFPPLTFFMVWSYILLARLLAFFSYRRALLFNAEFEDHAEHVYARFVEEHPEWQAQPVKNALVAEYTAAETWADVFRRIALDERDHRNTSFAFCGKPEYIVKYSGMPQKH